MPHSLELGSCKRMIRKQSDRGYIFQRSKEFSRGTQIDYVLGDLSPEELEQIPALSARVAQGIRDYSTIGLQRAMSALNVRPKTQKEGEKPQNAEKKWL